MFLMITAPPNGILVFDFIRFPKGVMDPNPLFLSIRP